MFCLLMIFLYQFVSVISMSLLDTDYVNWKFEFYSAIPLTQTQIIIRGIWWNWNNLSMRVSILILSVIF